MLSPNTGDATPYPLQTWRTEYQTNEYDAHPNSPISTSIPAAPSVGQPGPPARRTALTLAAFPGKARPMCIRRRRRQAGASICPSSCATTGDPSPSLGYEKQPFGMATSNASAARREATPARASTFCNRSPACAINQIYAPAWGCARQRYRPSAAAPPIPPPTSLAQGQRHPRKQAIRWVARW
jgi:hypothetical protein